MNWYALLIALALGHIYLVKLVECVKTDLTSIFNRYHVDEIWIEFGNNGKYFKYDKDIWSW